MKRRGALAAAWTAAFLLWPGSASASPSDPVPVLVSVLPQKYLVERVAGPRAAVSVLVGPGQSPHTYEPTSKQLARLAEAALFFRAGVSFEHVWIDRLRAVNPSMKIVDCREGVDLRRLEAHRGDARGGKDPLDPHIWTNPLLAKHIARTMAGALAEDDPGGKAVYETNLEAFSRELDLLDGEIRRSLKNIRIRTFLVLHPSWGYFAEAYGLEQIAIERGGGEPGAREFAGLLERAGREGIRTVFAQRQFSLRGAEAVAEALSGKVVVVDPLAEDYIANLRSTALQFAEAMR